MKNLLITCFCLIIVLSCSKETDNTITISPISAFTFSYNSSNYKIVQFQNASHFINTSSTYYWTFGDSSYSRNENPHYAYKADGDYKVVLKVTNGNLSDCSVQTVHITKQQIDSSAKAPIVAFVYSQNKNAFYFQDASIGTNLYTSYFWTFGDGDTAASIENPNHVYILDGVYSVVLKVTSNGKSYCFSKSILVTSSSNPAYDTIKPIPMFTYSYLNGTVYFVDASSFTTSATTYHWYFGDGDESNEENPAYSAYSVNGSYSVVLKVSNAFYTVSCEKQIVIPVPLVIDSTKKPIARFVYTKLPTGYNFQNASSNVLTTATYLWTFGDGTTSTAPNPPLHPYTNNGSYAVVLTVTNENISNSYSAVVTWP
jgi:PKD repeat protein